MALSNNGYNLEFPVNDDQVTRISNIFSKNNNEKSFAHLKWQYLNAPGGGAYTAFSVSHDGTDAAVYSVFKVKVKINERHGIASQSLDTLTDQGHRGKGLFSGLAEAVFERCEEDGVAFVYGFPNASSAPGFFNKLRWKKIGSPPFRVYLNNIFYPISYLVGKNIYIINILFYLYVLAKISYLRMRTGVVVVDEVGYQLAGYDSLWEKFSRNLPVSLWRSADYMHWRYQEKPGKSYFHKSVCMDGKVIGLVVYTVLAKHGGKVGYVMDLIFDPDKPMIGELLLAESVKHMSDLHVDAILAWADKSFSVNKAYVSLAFLTLPRRLQPIKLYFGYRAFGSIANAEIKKSDFYVSYADSDTV